MKPEVRNLIHLVGSRVRRAARKAAVLALALLLALSATPIQVSQAQSLSLFRDAEIEGTMRLYAAPLFEAAGLDPNSIKIHLVDENVLNAFVANGRHMFLYSGLMMESEDPNLLIGVIAHETGHLAAGHLARVGGAYENASAMVLLSTILGLAVGLAGGGEAGAAVMAVGAGAAQRSFLGYSRIQESAADQAGMKYLEATGQSAEGLRDFMATLAEYELFISSNSEIPYFLTHPLSSERVETMNAFIETSAYSGTPSDPDLVDRQRRMVAKLYGFLALPRTTYLQYPNRDESLYSRYAWSIAHYRERLMDDALMLIDGLIAEEPDNPWFHELRGQMLYETGSIAESIPSYRRSIDLAPDEPLLLIGLARALLQLDEPTGWEEATEYLNTARRLENDYPPTWYLLGDAYARLDRMPESNLYRAQMYYLRGNLSQANDFASRAIQGLDYGTPDWFIASDIINAAETTN
ncbi:MAG: M48 family metalloprotease [Rhodospirillales bacterium]|nr:M48 family metalloprotease [Rhodospirillales bacterium]